MQAIGPLVVVVGEEIPPTLPRRRYRRTPRVLSRVIGALATIAVHLLVSSPLLLGSAAQKTRPTEGLGLVAWASQGDQRESMILLDLSAISATSRDDQSTPETVSEGIDLEISKIVLASAEVSPPAELQLEDAEEAEEANQAAGDPAGAAILFGRYMGQIAARIERAWTRPRTPIPGGNFDCRAIISQDQNGVVLSVELQDCGGDPRWWESLTSAIFLASPLSSPPEQWLRAETITLNFTAAQFEEGRSQPHLYEPPEQRFARNAPPIQVLDDLEGPGDYELTSERGELLWKRKSSSVATSK